MNINVPQALKFDVFGKILDIGQSLLGCQESQAFGAKVVEGDAGAIVTVLEDNSQSSRRLRELMRYAFLQKWEALNPIRLPAAENNHRASRLVELGVEPVAQVEGAIGMRLVYGIATEMIDRDGELVFRVDGLEIVPCDDGLAPFAQGSDLAIF